MRYLIPTVLVATTAVFTAVGTASAHVEAFPTTTSGGDEALVSFTIPHGCDDKGTTKLEVNFPEEFVSVRGISSNGWIASGGTGAMTMESMSHDHEGGDDSTSHDEMESGDAMDHDTKDDGATAADSGDGMEMSDDGTHTVTWMTDTPLKSTDLGVVQAYMVVPATGDQLWMPTIQTCEGGGTNEWTTKDEGAEAPAPNLEFAAAASTEAVADSDNDDDDDEMGAGVIVAIALGALGTLLGLVAIVRGRRD